MGRGATESRGHTGDTLKAAGVSWSGGIEAMLEWGRLTEDIAGEDLARGEDDSRSKWDRALRAERAPQGPEQEDVVNTLEAEPWFRGRGY